jgi:chromosome segregation protein
MESALMYHEYSRLINELKPLEDAMRESSDSTESLKSALRAEDARLEELKLQLVEAEQVASKYRKRLEEIVSTISTLEAEEAAHRATVQAAHETIERTDRQRILTTEKRDSLSRRMNEQSLQRDAVIAELEEADLVFANAKERCETAQQTLVEQEAAAAAHSDSLQDKRRHLAVAEKSRTDDLAHHASITGQRESALHAVDSIIEERSKISIELGELKQKQAAAIQEEVRIQQENRLRREELEHSQNRRSELLEESRLLMALEQATQSKLDLLVTLEEKGPRSSAPLRILREANIPGLLSLLGDSVNVDDRYRRPLQSVLGSAAYFYLTDSIESTQRAIDSLRSDEAGRTTFIPIEDFRTAYDKTFELPENALCKAIDIIAEPDRNAALQCYLGHVVIVEKWDDALALRKWCLENNCTAVTLDGEWVDAHGVVYAGSQESRLPVDLGLTGQRNELRQSLDSTLTRLTETKRQLSESEQLIQSLQLELGECNRRLESAGKSITQLRENEVRLNTLLNALDQREGDAHSRIHECDLKCSQIQQKIAAADAEIGESKKQLADLTHIGEEIAERVSFARSEQNAERDRLHSCERSRDSIKHKLMLIDADIERVLQSLKDLEETQAANEQASEKAINDIVRLEARLKEIASGLSEYFKLRDERVREVDTSAQTLDDLRGQITAREDTLRRLRSGQEDAQVGERKLSMDVARLQGELEALLVNARNQYNMNPAALDFLENHPEIVDVETSPELVQEYKQRIDNLGPVNLLAVEEYEQENTRLDGMLKNREDLLQAKTTLEETIHKINETAEAKFLHTFEAVRANFQTLFLEFFPAGEADLILSGKDLLEADITMWANPSGKRLKSLSLMSGGEKTMTAIALLFSLYRVKPSPFCVLDEVDAPLDDSNIDRFTRMLRHHSKETQFILVTHNKRTMEIADNLYGVTMQEEGVSKLVSVRLLREQEPAETA